MAPCTLLDEEKSVLLPDNRQIAVDHSRLKCRKESHRRTQVWGPFFCPESRSTEKMFESFLAFTADIVSVSSFNGIGHFSSSCPVISSHLTIWNQIGIIVISCFDERGPRITMRQIIARTHAACCVRETARVTRRMTTCMNGFCVSF